MVQEVIGNYSAANMPLEVIYFDIPYMDNYADFSVDEVAFPDL
jgi:alpha-glucosidase (family GH31 glycosyl hydrolase)